MGTVIIKLLRSSKVALTRDFLLLLSTPIFSLLTPTFPSIPTTPWWCNIVFALLSGLLQEKKFRGFHLAIFIIIAITSQAQDPAWGLHYLLQVFLLIIHLRMEGIATWCVNSPIRSTVNQNFSELHSSLAPHMSSLQQEGNDVVSALWRSNINSDSIYNGS